MGKWNKQVINVGTKWNKDITKPISLNNGDLLYLPVIGNILNKKGIIQLNYISKSSMEIIVSYGEPINEFSSTLIEKLDNDYFGATETNL